MSKKKTTAQVPAAVLSKYFRAENVEMLRSEIHFADYNPRTIGPDELKTLRKGIRKFGLVGGIVVNRRTGNTLVQGHQRLTVMDDLQKYDAETHANDYRIRADLIDVDDKAEKELVILLNNPNAQGRWDYDRLKAILPGIDAANAGLSDTDLAMMGIGLEQSLAAIGSADVPSVTSAMMSGLAPSSDTGGGDTLPAEESTGGQMMMDMDGTDVSEDAVEADRQAKIRHMKDVKDTASRKAQECAEQAAAYIMVSFDNMDNMQDFLCRFNIPELTQIVKGEELLALLDVME